MYSKSLCHHCYFQQFFSHGFSKTMFLFSDMERWGWIGTFIGKVLVYNSKNNDSECFSFSHTTCSSQPLPPWNNEELLIHGRKMRCLENGIKFGCHQNFPVSLDVVEGIIPFFARTSQILLYMYSFSLFVEILFPDLGYSLSQIETRYTWRVRYMGKTEGECHLQIVQ